MQALSNPLTFDGSQFYPGMFTNEKKQEFYKLGAFRGAVEDAVFILRKGGIDAYITTFDTPTDNSADAVVLITDRIGTPVVMMRRLYKDTRKTSNAAHIELLCRHAEMKDRGSAHSVISVKPQYISKILKKHVYTIRNNLNEDNSKVMVLPFGEVASHAEAKHNNPSRKVTLDFRTLDIALMLRLIDGTETQQTLTPAMSQRVDVVRSTVNNILNDINKVRDTVNSFYSQPKWVVMYHGSVAYGSPYVTVAAVRVKCDKRGCLNSETPVTTIGAYDFQFEYLLPQQVYLSMEDFYAKVGEVPATDVKLSIKTHIIRHDTSNLFDEEVGIPCGYGMDFDSGTFMARGNRSNGGLIYCFVSDCNVGE